MSGIVERRFNQIRAQLELWERVDPDVLDVEVARTAFADSRRLLGEMVRAAETEAAAVRALPWFAAGAGVGALVAAVVGLMMK